MRAVGSVGEEEGELSFPYSCTVVGLEVIVADVGNHRLSSFSRATGRFVRCIGGPGKAPGQFHGPRAVTALARPKTAREASTTGSVASFFTPSLGSAGAAALARAGAAADGGGAAPVGAGAGVVIDGETAMLDRDLLLVVCEQRRVQILTMAGVPVQAISFDASPKTDLWSLCAIGRFVYLSDRGCNCVHVLTPVRHLASNSDAANARYASMTPRSVAKAAQCASINSLMSEALATDEWSPTPRRQQLPAASTVRSLGVPRIPAATLEQTSACADAPSPHAHAYASDAVGAPAAPLAAGGRSCSRPPKASPRPPLASAPGGSASAAMRRMAPAGSPYKSPLRREAREPWEEPREGGPARERDIGATALDDGPGGAGSGGEDDTSPLQEAVRRLRTGGGGSPDGASPRASAATATAAMASPTPRGTEQIVPGGLGVLGRAGGKALRAGSARAGSPLKSPRRGGSISIRLSKMSPRRAVRSAAPATAVGGAPAPAAEGDGGSTSSIEQRV